MGSRPRHAVVAVDGELKRLAQGLQEALGPSYVVVLSPPPRDAAAVIVPPRLSAIRAQRSGRARRLIVV